MLESFNAKTGLQYQKLTEEEKKSRGILGRLVGIIADFKNATRNGRRYTEELWDRTFNDPIVREKLENRCILGELGHPADRQETDIEKVAICLAEMPKKGNDGKLHGVFDILDTPNGRILKTLCDYGCNVGVSSRGGGDTYEDVNGQETVESSTYEFECFDVVILPAVKMARPAYVNESFDVHHKNLKTALMEELDRSSDDDKRVMENTLKDLNIDYSSDQEVETSDSVDNIDDSSDTVVAAVDDRADTIKELQEALTRQQELELQVESLQHKLSVCYTKESRYSDRLERANSKLFASDTENKKLSEQVDKLTKENARLSESVSSLTESLSNAKAELDSSNASLDGYRSRFDGVTSQLNESKSSRKTLSEELATKKNELIQLNQEFTDFKNTSDKKLREAVAQKQTAENTVAKLNEELLDVKRDATILRGQYDACREKSKNLVEKYKSIAKTAVDKYIDLQATKIGVSKEDIRSRLSESCSFKDIDKVCEDMQQYKLNLTSLPFSTLADRKPRKILIKESKDSLLATKDNSSYYIDDDVDSTLLTFTN